MDLKDLYAESDLWILDAGGSEGFRSMLKFLEQVPIDDII